MFEKLVFCAKYPFSAETKEVIGEEEFTLERLDSEWGKQVVERAKRRVLEAIKRGVVDVNVDLASLDLEILSFPVARLIVACIDNPFLTTRYAIAESKRLNFLLLREDEKTLLKLAKELLGVDIGRVELKIGDEISSTCITLYKVPMNIYVSLSSNFNDPRWRLVNRVVLNGFVYVKKEELIRLTSEALKEAIISRRPHLPAKLPLSIKEAVNELLPLLAREEKSVELAGGLVKEALPPCIRILLEQLLAGANLSHAARFTLVSFLSKIGLGEEEIFQLFSRIPDFNPDKTRYQIEHILGKRGSGTKYIPPNCRTMKTYGLCPSTRDKLCGKVSHPLTYYLIRLRGLRKGGQKINIKD